MESVTEIKEKNGVRNESESRPSTESIVRSSSLLTATCLIVKDVRMRAHFSNWDSISREVSPISLPTLAKKMRYLPDLPYLFVFSNRYSVMI